MTYLNIATLLLFLSILVMSLTLIALMRKKPVVDPRPVQAIDPVHAQVIATQEVELRRLHRAISAKDEAINQAILIMVCIGGPLNDNRLQFNKEQRQVFHDIHQVLRDAHEGEDDAG